MTVSLVVYLESDLVGDDGGVAVGDVGKGSSVNKDWGALQGLHQIGLDGIFHQHC